MNQKPLRVQKVESELRQAIGTALSEMLFVTGGVLVTVVEVDAAKDLRTARVFVSVLPEEYSEEILEELEHIRGDVQKRIAKNIRMKYLPKLQWKMDRSVKEMDRIGKIINQERHKEED